MRPEGTKVKRIAGSLIAAGVFAALAGCGEETQTTSPISADPQIDGVATAPMSRYSGPGSRWEYDLNEDGSFAVRRDEGSGGELVVTGTYQATAAGFLSMTVDSASGIGADAVGESLWAIEVPNFLLVMSPVSADGGHFVPMVSGSECPDSDQSNNWINVKPGSSQDAASDTESFFGAFNFTNSGTETVLATRHALTDGNANQGSQSLGNGFCSDGVVETGDATIHLSVPGPAIAHIGTSETDGGAYALALPKVTVGPIADFDGSYVGVLSDSGINSGQSVWPVAVSCAAGICGGDTVTDVVTGSTGGAAFTVDLFGTTNDPSTGLITGTLTMSGATGNIACTVDADVVATGQRMLSCVGQSPSRSYRTVNVILASVD